MAAAAAGVRRFVYVSSSEAFGSASRVPMAEDHPFDSDDDLRREQAGRRDLREGVSSHARAADGDGSAVQHLRAALAFRGRVRRSDPEVRSPHHERQAPADSWRRSADARLHARLRHGRRYRPRVRLRCADRLVGERGARRGSDDQRYRAPHAQACGRPDLARGARTRSGPPTCGAILPTSRAPGASCIFRRRWTSRAGIARYVDWFRRRIPNRRRCSDTSRPSPGRPQNGRSSEHDPHSDSRGSVFTARVRRRGSARRRGRAGVGLGVAGAEGRGVRAALRRARRALPTASRRRPARPRCIWR